MHDMKRKMDWMPRFLSVALLALGAALLALGPVPVAAPARAGLPPAPPRLSSYQLRVPPGPPGLAFYQPPAWLVAGKPGTAIWARPAPTPAAMSGLADTTLVLYRSVLPDGEPTAVSGLIFMPHGRPPRGGWKLISWAHGTSGIADVCALSREQANFAPYSLLARWLTSGYAITQTDYQGLGTPGVHLYLVGRAEAASVVHIALAARQLYPGIGRRFAIAGLSQGGQAALFAAAEAKRDAPSLKLVGVEALAPSSHIAEQFKAAVALTTPGGETTALGGMILVSAAADSPGVQLNALLTPQALALVPAVGQECLTQLEQPDSWGGLAPADLLRPGVDTTALYQVLDAMNPALAIHTPVLLLQGEADTTVLPAVTNALDAQLNALGDSVEYDTFPGVTHIGIINAGAADATSWLAQRFADLPRHK